MLSICIAPSIVFYQVGHLEVSSCIAQGNILLRFGSSFGALVLIQQLCLSLGTPPHEQLHWSDVFFLRFGNSCRALVLLRQLCCLLGTPPNEQLRKGASFCIWATLFGRLYCSSDCVSHLGHLEMSCCIAQWTMFLFLDNSC